MSKEDINNVNQSEQELNREEVVEETAKVSREELAQWYVVHTYSTHEKAVKQSLESMIDNNNLQDEIFEIAIPTKEEMVEKDGKRKVVERKKFPSYVFIKMILSDKILYIVRNTKGITGFVGPQGKALPLTNEEVKKMGLEKVTIEELNVKVGDNVRIVSGPLESFLGVVDNVSSEKEKIRVMVQMFGRETPIDLDFNQVEVIN
ncbi:MAG: transcription termination/antitermination protein NusG [Christensenellales bacterium]|jgi:transcriptional antiterminator NusG|nr:transcription termination/antitermination factor NusG [Clostridiales bacterium]